MRWGPINRAGIQEYMKRRKDIIIDEHIEEEKLFEWDFSINQKL